MTEWDLFHRACTASILLCIECLLQLKIDSMKHCLLYMLLMMWSVAAFGNDTVGSNQIYLSRLQQLYFNRVNIFNSSSEPDLLQTKNTLGSYSVIGFQRVTRGGLIMRLGIGLSERRYEISIVKQLQDADPAAPFRLVNASPIKLSIRSIDPEIMFGYQKRLNARLSVNAMAGFQQKRYNTEVNERATVYSTYTYPINNIMFVELYSYSIKMGRNSGTSYRNIRWLSNHVALVKLSVGAQYSYKKSFLKFLHLDVETCLRLDSWLSTEQAVYVASRVYSLGTYVDATYDDRFFSIGIRAGLGLWK